MAATRPTTDHVLDISTLTERLLVRINKRDYQLRTIHQLSLEGTLIYEQHYRPYLRLLRKLRKRSSFTPKEGQQIATLLRRLVPVVLDAPASVLEQLSDVHRLNVMVAFMRGSRLDGAVSAGRQTGRRSTGSKSSRSSLASTEGRP